MAFDPDAYLASAPVKAFDPDAYLAGAPEPQISQEVIDKYPDPDYPNYSPVDLAEIEAGNKPAAQIDYENKLEQNKRLRQLAMVNPIQAENIAETSGVDRAAIGFQTGLRQVARGLGLGGADQTVIDAENALSGVSSTARAAEIAGNAAPFLAPSLAASGVASIPLRIGAQSLVGGAEGGIVAKGTGQDTAGVTTSALAGAAIGGGIEAFGAAVNRWAVPLVQKYFGTGARALDDAGNPTPALVTAMEKEGVTFDDLLARAETSLGGESSKDLTAEQALNNRARQQAFENLNLTPTEAQRTRDKDLFRVQQDRAKETSRVTSALERQQQQLNAAAAQTIKDTGGDAIEATASPIEVVVNRSLREDKEISDLYKAAREAAPNEKMVKFNNASQILRQYAPDNQLSNGVIESLQGAMQQTGALDGFRPSGRISVDAAEKIRQKANQIYEGANPQGRMIIRAFKDALDKDVGDAAGQDWFAQARAAKARFESGLDREKFHKFDQRNTNLVRDILNNKVTSDEIQQGVLTRAGSRYKAQDLVDLKRYLHSGTEEDIKAGAKAWNDIRASALQQIRDSAFSGSIGQNQTQALTRAGLEKGLKQIGRQKFNVLFTPTEQKFLYDLANVARYIEPPPGTYMGSGPSAPAIQALENRMNGLFGEVAGFLSQKLKGRMSDAQVLRLNDDLAKIERERLTENLKYYRQAATAAGATAVIPGSQKEEQK